jgi:hypothetical protein
MHSHLNFNDQSRDRTPTSFLSGASLSVCAGVGASGVVEQEGLFADKRDTIRIPPKQPYVQCLYICLSLQHTWNIDKETKMAKVQLKKGRAAAASAAKKSAKSKAPVAKITKKKAKSTIEVNDDDASSSDEKEEMMKSGKKGGRKNDDMIDNDSSGDEDDDDKSSSSEEGGGAKGRKTFGDENDNWLKQKDNKNSNKKKQDLLSSDDESERDEMMNDEFDVKNGDDDSDDDEDELEIERQSKQIDREMELEAEEAEDDLRHTIATHTSVYHLPTEEELIRDHDRVSRPSVCTFTQCQEAPQRMKQILKRQYTNSICLAASVSRSYQRPS